MATKRSNLKSSIIDFLNAFSTNINAKKDVDELYSEGFQGKTIKLFAMAIKDKWSKDGFYKWNNRVKYCLQNKIPVMYDPLTASLKFGITLDEAELKITNLKSQKTTSLKGFCERHGKERGEALFKKFQLSSRKSSVNILNEYKQKYPHTWKCEYSNYMRRKSKWCKEYYLSRQDCTKEEACKLAREYYLQKCGLLCSVYYDKGYTDEDIDIILEKINTKRIFNNTRNPANLQRIFGDEWLAHHQEINNKLRETMEKKGVWLSLDKLDDWKKYKMEVGFWTSQSINENEALFEKRSKEYHVDHRYSQKQGYINDISPRVIGSVVNLEILERSKNCSKQSRSSISIDELYRLYNEYENQKNNKI
jgi:predicted nucleotidyltransferase